MTTSPDPAGPTPLNYAQGPRSDLKVIAMRQRAVMYCILAYIGLYVILILFRSTPALAGVVALCILGTMVTAAVFIFMLSLSLYSVGTGIVMGLLTMIPLLGLLVLLIINGRATKILRDNGVRVGLLGANPSLIP
jgi:hypothetical protein